MPKITYKTEYETTKKSVTYAVSKSCCDKLQRVEPDWQVCPYCGEKITYETVVVKTGDEVPADASV